MSIIFKYKTIITYNNNHNIREGVMDLPLGEKLKAVMDEQKITQKSLAKKLNIAPTTLNGYISNKREPDLETLKNIAQALGVTVDYLLGVEGGMIDLSAKEEALIRQLRRMTPSQRDVVAELIKVMTQKNKA